MKTAAILKVAIWNIPFVWHLFTILGEGFWLNTWVGWINSPTFVLEFDRVVWLISFLTHKRLSSKIYLYILKFACEAFIFCALRHSLFVHCFSFLPESNIVNHHSSWSHILLHWQWDNHVVTSVSVKQPWITLHESSENLWNSLKHSTAELCAYSTEYAIGPVFSAIESRNPVIDRGGVLSTAQSLLFWWLIPCISWRDTARKPNSIQVQQCYIVYEAFMKGIMSSH